MKDNFEVIFEAVKYFNTCCLDLNTEILKGDTRTRETRPLRFCFRTDKKYMQLLRALANYYDLPMNRIIENLVLEEAQELLSLAVDKEIKSL